ncbi:MAG: deoxyribodipyrimidine photo-lyase [Solirubrobacterales bacterium]
MSTSIVWFRRDLRLADNPALAAAARAERILPVFCFEDGPLRGRHHSPNRNAYLLASLRELGDGLRAAGAALRYRSGDPAVELPRLAAECGAEEVHVNRDHTAHARSRDRRVAAALEEAGVKLVGHGGLTCAEPARILTADGHPFRVFTPFHRAWLEAERRDPAPRPRSLEEPAGIAVGRPPSEADVAVDAAAKRRAEEAKAGERRSRELMRRAIERAGDYDRIRDLPGRDETTRLSPALHFGTVSALELERELASKRSDGAKALRRQLAWRDFWLNVIRNNPGNRSEEYDERFRGMSWRDDPESLEAWRRGRTGVPWIDSGMRQLLEEGWMHNRVRMAVASYLTKNLLIDWREGEAHFMRHLLDGDESQNNGNWQWAASVGADPQPYFRIFNPVRQQERFDPGGEYVRRWVPELRRFPDGHLAAPWEAPEEVQREAGCVVGEDYPEPLVDLRDSREEAISRFRDQAG